MNAENVKLLVFLLFTVICAVSDLKTGTISVCVYIFFFMAGTVFCTVELLAAVISGPGLWIWSGSGLLPADTKTIAGVLIALLPGFIFLLIHLFSGQTVGTGDVLYYLIAAMYISGVQILRLFVFSLVIASVIALIIILKCRLAGAAEMRKPKSIPFLTVTGAALFMDMALRLQI